jgi:hypothetical protein
MLADRRALRDDPPNIAKPPKRFRSRLRCRHPGCHKLIYHALDVEPQLRLDIRSKPGLNAPPPSRAPARHH